MTEILLSIHSVLRWVVLAFAVVAIVANVLALAQKRSANDPLVKNGQRIWTISLDIQWLVGLILIVVMASASNAGVPRYQFEHAFANTIALIVAHAAAGFRRSADRTRLIVNLVSIVLALVIIVIGVASVGGWS